jgi:hypothetical protein
LSSAHRTGIGRSMESLALDERFRRLLSRPFGRRQDQRRSGDGFEGAALDVHPVGLVSGLSVRGPRSV